MLLPGRQRAHTVYSEEGDDSRGRVRRRKSRKKATTRKKRERESRRRREYVKAAKKGPDRGWKGSHRGGREYIGGPRIRVCTSDPLL